MSDRAFRFCGEELFATAQGALWWPAAATLIVADLHLEKGSSFGRKGAFLPPYDSRATLAALAALCERLAPRRVVCLGDSFHDGNGCDRLCDDDGDRLKALTQRHAFLWIAGNHDPRPAADLGGRAVTELALGPLVLRHAALAAVRDGGEISGHFHPKASVSVIGRRLSGRCFVTDGRRLILPAFGAYTGGLDVFDAAIARLLAPAFVVHLLGRARIHTLPHARLVRSHWAMRPAAPG